jgi:hypothetical protein
VTIDPTSSQPQEPRSVAPTSASAPPDKVLSVTRASAAWVATANALPTCPRSAVPQAQPLGRCMTCRRAVWTMRAGRSLGGNFRALGGVRPSGGSPRDLAR